MKITRRELRRLIAEQNFDGQTGKSQNPAGDALLMNKANIDVQKHLNVLQGAADEVQQLKASVGELSLPPQLHNKLSPAGMKALGVFQQSVLDFEKNFQLALQYLNKVKGVESQRAAAGQFTGNNPATAPEKKEQGFFAKAGEFLKKAISGASAVSGAYSALKGGGTVNEIKMIKKQNKYSVVDVMSEMFEDDSNSEHLNEFITKLGKVKDSELAGASSTDAYTLYKAMKGMGTDEKMVQKVIADRKNDLKALSDEYGKLLAVAGEDDDLATWLTDDGMGAEAQMVRSAVAGGGSSVGASQPAAPVTTQAVGAAAGAPSAGITAPEITSLAQLPPGSQQQPDKTWLLPDGRKTGPIMIESLSRGALIRRRYSRY